MGAQVPARPAPKLGQDTDALLAELGYDPATIAALRTRGVI
jgi:crotonobetainyl-CoA:carnitine CoA-transferase CaiB-like acyl-CoA transferase